MVRRNRDFSVAGVSNVLLFGVKMEDSRTRPKEQKESHLRKLPEMPKLPTLKIENLPYL
jgi:hypothetical protein